MPHHSMITLMFNEHVGLWLTAKERSIAEKLLQRYSASYVKDYIVDLRRQVLRVQPHEIKKF